MMRLEDDALYRGAFSHTKAPLEEEHVLTPEHGERACAHTRYITPNLTRERAHSQKVSVTWSV